MKSFLALGILLVFLGCQHKEKSLRVAASSVPHAEMLEVIKPDLLEKGIRLEIIEVDDYNLPNRLLAEKQVDANFFQHRPFLELQQKEFGYHFTILKRVHFEPLGIYSYRHTSINEIPEGSFVAIPNDPTNEARALNLLEKAHLITLKDSTKLLSTLIDVQQNPKKLHFHEVDAAFLPRSLDDVNIAVIPANFALQANLLPKSDALALETDNSPYTNLLVVRAGEEHSAPLELLAQTLVSDKLRAFLKEKYKGALELETDSN